MAIIFLSRLEVGFGRRRLYDIEQSDWPDRSCGRARFYPTGKYFVYATGYDEYGQWDSDWALVYVFEMDLDISGVSDDDEEDPGGYVRLNDDDDNMNGTPDKDETGPVNMENDLVQISLSYKPSSLPGYAKLESPYGGQNHIRVWKSPTKGIGNMIIGGSDDKEVWPIGEMPPTLWVEGYSTGPAELWLLFTPDQQVYPGGGYNHDPVKFTVYNLQITEPDENPATDNNFTFNWASPGVCNITGAGTTEISGMDPNLHWSIASISGSTLTSNPPDRKGPTITFTYTTLPSSWVGWKWLFLDHPLVTDTDYQLVEIFFSRDATNNPGGTNPNWYYYWSQTGASTGTHHYNAAIPWDGCYTWGDNFFEIGPSAKDQDGGLVVKGDGIDNFGSSCLHEKTHMDYYFSAWNPYDPDSDQDENVGDLLRDTDEPNMTGLNGLPYDANRIDTNGDMYTDDEDYACKYENNWQIGSYDGQDWANPGHQTNR